MAEAVEGRSWHMAANVGDDLVGEVAEIHGGVRWERKGGRGKVEKWNEISALFVLPEDLRLKMLT